MVKKTWAEKMAAMTEEERTKARAEAAAKKRKLYAQKKKGAEPAGDAEWIYEFERSRAVAIVAGVEVSDTERKILKMLGEGDGTEVAKKFGVSMKTVTDWREALLEAHEAAHMTAEARVDEQPQPAAPEIKAAGTPDTPTKDIQPAPTNTSIGEPIDPEVWEAKKKADAELRKRALEMLAEGRSVSGTAKELGVSKQSVFYWKKIAMNTEITTEPQPAGGDKDSIRHISEVIGETFDGQAIAPEIKTENKAKPESHDTAAPQKGGAQIGAAEPEFMPHAEPTKPTPQAVPMEDEPDACAGEGGFAGADEAETVSGTGGQRAIFADEPHSGMERALAARAEARARRKREAARSSVDAAAEAADPERVGEIRAALGQFYDITEVASALRVTTRTVLTYLRSAELDGVKVGGVWRVSLNALRKFMKVE